MTIEAGDAIHLAGTPGRIASPGSPRAATLMRALQRAAAKREGVLVPHAGVAIDRSSAALAGGLRVALRERELRVRAGGTFVIPCRSAHRTGAAIERHASTIETRALAIARDTRSEPTADDDVRL